MMTRTAADYQTRLNLDWTPSKYQVDVFDWIQDGRKHRVVEAVAGSGKTTTIVAAARLITGSGLFLAFNKVIANMLGTKLAGTKMRASTVHSHGFAAIRDAVGRVRVDQAKYADRIDMIRDAAVNYGDLALGRDGSRALTPAELNAINDDGFPVRAIAKLLDLARLNLADPTDADFAGALMDLARHHNIRTDGVADIVAAVVRKLMVWGWDHPDVVDFADMVWLPVANGYAPPKFAWVFVDECQDISRAHFALIQNSILPGGRVLLVGDPRQAIYGFAGADSESFARIVAATGVTPLPLSVCYRCPASVLAMAREYCPQIEAREGAPEGVVRESTVDAWVADAREGDLGLCRLNAPLTSLFFALVAEGVSASVRGKDIGKGLIKTVRKCAKGLSTLGATFGKRLNVWREKETAIARRRYKDADALAERIEGIDDKVSCVEVIMDRSGAKTAGDLVRSIESIFTDDNKTSVVLSSVHRAKGLEAPRVFICKPDRLGVARADAQPWMVEQEDNLCYVAYTRAQVELVFLRDEAPEPPKPTRDTIEVTAAPTWNPPAPLPDVAADAPDTYHPTSRPSRVALARMIDARLRAKGFVPTSAPGAGETVYTRPITDTLNCLVYSTIVDGACRGLGQDAIKVCLVADDGQTRGERKSKRVNRVGKLADILGRVQSRIDDLTK